MPQPGPFSTGSTTIHALPANRLKKREVANAVTAQSMAMFLHSLDDHLTDGTFLFPL